MSIKRLPLLVLLALAPMPSFAALGLGANTQVSASYTGTPIATGSLTTASSGSTFVIIADGPSGCATFTPGDSKSNSYTSILTETDSSDGIMSEIFYSANATGGSGFTANLACGVHTTIILTFIEITGAATSSVLDQYTGTSTSFTPASMPLTTTSPNEFLVAHLYPANLGAITCAGSYSAVPNSSQSCYHIVSSAGTYDPNIAFAGGGRTTGLHATFVQASAVSAPPPQPSPFAIGASLLPRGVDLASFAH